MRVLYLQPAAQWGGAERQAATVIPLLRDYGVEAIPYVGPGSTIVEWLEERGVFDYVFTQNIPGAWRTPRGLARALLPWRYARCLTRCRDEIARLVRELRIDVLFAAMPWSWIAATPVARRLGVRIVWRAGGTECSPAQQRILSLWAPRHKPDLLICNGDAVRNLYAPLIGAPAVTVRNGIDLEQFRPGAGDPRKLRPPGVSLVVGFAARLVPQKRPEDFIAAAARFASRSDVAFVLAGEGSRRTRYTELARAAGASTLRVVGHVPNMCDFYAACDVLVLPSRSEGCPNVVLEAMAMKTAVIAADSPATREIVNDGVDAMLYPTGDIDALEAALARVIDEQSLRRLMVERGYRRVSQQLTASACAEQTAALLRRVAFARAPQQLRATTPIPSVHS